MIGFGAVAYGLLEIFNKEGTFLDCNFTIIEPKDKSDELNKLFANRPKGYTFIQKEITPRNCSRLLNICDENTFIVNLSVNVDSIMVLKQARRHKSNYVDTSLEMYENHIQPKIAIEDITEYKQFEKNNLYHQNEMAFKAMKGSRKTRVISCGMNPFLVNQFAKRALRFYGESKGVDVDEMDGDYAKAGWELGLKRILITEYDTQKFKTKSNKQLFVNDWSARGLESEALDLVMMSLNPSDMKKYGKKYNLIKPTEGDRTTSIRFLPVRGMDMMEQATILDYEGNPFRYRGYLIPHAETITLSQFFHYKPPRSTLKKQSPSIYYIYRMCDEAIRALDFIRENDYKPLPFEHVVMGNEIKSGWDSVGVLLEFKDLERLADKKINRVWAGTVLSIDDTRAMGFESGPTVIQVVSSVNACIHYEIDFSGKGLNNAETIPHKYIFERTEKYLGKVYMKML